MVTLYAMYVRPSVIRSHSVTPLGHLGQSCEHPVSSHAIMKLPTQTVTPSNPACLYANDYGRLRISKRSVSVSRDPNHTRRDARLSPSPQSCHHCHSP